MESYESFESFLPPTPIDGHVAVLGCEDRVASVVMGWNPVPVFACDGVRQLAVVVWARTKLLQRTLADYSASDARLVACLARIDAAIAGMSERLDALEETLG